MWIYFEFNNKILFKIGYFDCWLEVNEMMGILLGVLGSVGWV